MTRPITIADLREVEGHQNGFKMPDVNNPLYFGQIALVDKDGELLGIAVVKLTSEISLIFKKDANKFKRAKAYLELFPTIEAICAARGIEDTHIFIAGDDAEHHRSVIINHGFEDAVGIPMYYRLGARAWLKTTNSTQQMRRRELTLSATCQPSKLTKDSMEEDHLVSLG